MDIVSIIKSDTSGNISKRLQGEDDTVNYGAMTDSNPVVVPESSTQENAMTGSIPNKEQVLGVNSGKNKESVYKPSIYITEDQRLANNAHEGSAKSTDKPLVGASDNGVTPNARSSDKNNFASKFQIGKDAEKFKENLAAVPEGFKDYMTKEGDALVQDLADLVNSPLSRKYSAFNTNIKLFGRYAWNCYHLIDKDKSNPFVILPWAEKLAFMEKLPSNAGEAKKMALDLAKKLAKKAIKAMKGKDDVPKSENGVEPETRDATKVNKSPTYKEYTDNSKATSPVKDLQKGKGHSASEYKYDISNPSKFNERYINNNDKHLGPYFKGYADISLFEGRQDRFYDFEIYAPQSLRNKGLPDIPTAASGLKIDVSTNLTSVKMISLADGEKFELGSFGSATRTLKLTDNVASIQMTMFETEDIQVRKWMQNYIKYMYGNNPTPLVHRSFYQGYYYITYYYLDVDRSVIQERTFYGLPTFDLSMTPSDGGDMKSFDVAWMIIGESPTREN